MSFQSCRNLGLKYSGEQCSPVFVYVDETQKLIDVDQSFCNVRQYEMNLNHVGEIAGTSSKRPLPYCDRCVGFKNYTEAATFWEKVRREIGENQSERISGKIKEPIGTVKD